MGLTNSFMKNRTGGLRFTPGFTGKTLIHPNQVAIANQAFGADAAAVAEAEELIAASRGGAQRFKGRMIESMHVDEAKLTIERSRHRTGAAPS